MAEVERVIASVVYKISPTYDVIRASMSYLPCHDFMNGRRERLSFQTDASQVQKPDIAFIECLDFVSSLWISLPQDEAGR